MNAIVALLAKGIPYLLNNIPLVSRLLNATVGNKPWFKSLTIVSGILWFVVHFVSGADILPAGMDAFVDKLNGEFNVLGPLLVALGVRKSFNENLAKLGVTIPPDVPAASPPPAAPPK